jgi:hypothetical protein
MMCDTRGDEVDYREEIQKASRVIPDSVKTGSVQQSIRWKEQAMQSLRVANNPKASEYELRTAYTNLKRYG